MIYDLDKLIEGRFHIKENIKALEEALVKENEKLAEYEEHIKASQAILEQHGQAGKAVLEQHGEQDEGSG